MIAQIKNAEPLDYEQELAQLRSEENALFNEALSSPKEEMLGKFVQIWTRREQILKEVEMSITPMPEGLPLNSNTAKSVSFEPYTLEEWKAIPKPGRWKYITPSYLPPCWIKNDSPGRYDSLPEVIVKMYGLTARQILILEGKIEAEKPVTTQSVVDSTRIFGCAEPLSARESCGYFFQTQQPFMS